MRLSKIKALVATLAIAGSAFGAYVGTATASNSGDGLCHHFDPGYTYMGTLYPWGTYLGCYRDNGFGAPTYIAGSAATIRGTHANSDVIWVANFFDTFTNYISTSAAHESKGTAWGPGVTIPANAVKWSFTVFNDQTALPNDVYYYKGF